MEENKLVSCIDKIYEIRDGMEFSIKQAEQLVSYNDELANIIARAKGTKNNFKELVKETKEQVIGYKNQREVLKEKIAYANAIIDYYKKGHEENASEEDKKTADLVEQIVTTIFLMLSIVPTENEQRIENEKRIAEEKRLKEQKEVQAKNVKA